MWSFECVGCGEPGPRLCARCVGERPFQTWEGPELIGRGHAAADYADPLGDAVRRAKGQADRGLARIVARAFARRVAGDPHVLAALHTADVITWAPSPWTRRATRGFSLAALLAEAVGELTPTPVQRTLTVRPGRRQASLGRRSRARNLRNRVRACWRVSGGVVLIDDVVTTGATATACAQELLNSGASHVDLLTVCHVTDVVVGGAGAVPDGFVQIL